MSDAITPSDNHDPIEGYCVRCKAQVEMLTPEAVWTSRGTPGTRGTCPTCGGSVFRMGATYLHDGQPRPKAVALQMGTRNRPKLAPNTVYINYTPDDEATAQQLAADLEKVGLTVWLHDPSPQAVNWAGGVHPALKDCNRMVWLLSSASATDATNSTAWAFFREKRKPVVIALLDTTAPPDDLRRSARYDFSDKGDYKHAFRQMVQALSR